MTLTVHKQMSGYSGALLYLMSASSGSYFVRKQARSPAHSARLRRQMDKHRYIHALSGRPFGVPRVLGDGVQDGCFHYDMEFVDGMDSPSVLGTTSLIEVRSIADQVVDALRFFADQPTYETVGEGLYCELSRRVIAVTRLRIGLLESDAICLLQGVDDLAKSGALAHTLCHGDLSLENIIIERGGRLLLVDFLDSPLCHFWQDVSKLFLDLEGHWYARRYPRISEWTLAALRDRTLSFMSQNHPGYARYHHLLVALNFLRILPYAKGADDRALLLGRIHQMTKHFASSIP